MMHSTNDNQNNTSGFSKILFSKPIYRIGLFVCIAIFLLSVMAFALLHKNESKWLLVFPISSLVIILLVFW